MNFGGFFQGLGQKIGGIAKTGASKIGNIDKLSFMPQTPDVNKLTFMPETIKDVNKLTFLPEGQKQPNFLDRVKNRYNNMTDEQKQGLFSGLGGIAPQQYQPQEIPQLQLSNQDFSWAFQPTRGSFLNG